MVFTLFGDFTFNGNKQHLIGHDCYNFLNVIINQ